MDFEEMGAEELIKFVEAILLHTQTLTTEIANDFTAEGVEKIKQLVQFIDEEAISAIEILLERYASEMSIEMNIGGNR